jgi:predicted nucleic acid-binding protein
MSLCQRILARLPVAATANLVGRERGVGRTLNHGSSVFEGPSSAVIAAALNTGAGRVESFVLPHSYRHLSSWLTARVRGPMTLPALIYELACAGLIKAWASPAILEEYADVLGDHPEFVAEIVDSFPVCYPLTELNVIRHEPDNRFLECALAANVEFIVTVNRLGSRHLLFNRARTRSVATRRTLLMSSSRVLGRLLKSLRRCSKS